MSTHFALTSDWGMIKAQSSRHQGTWDISGQWSIQVKECWVGHRAAPEMPERIFRAAHDTCKPELTQTPSFPLPLVSFWHLSSNPFFYFLPQNLRSKFQRKTTSSGRTNTRGIRRRRRRRRSQDWEGAGAWCWGWYEASVLRVCRVCVSKCAHVCCVLCARRLSAPSMRLLLGLVVVSVALPGCPAPFSPALADAWTTLLAFCCSADGGAWRNIGKKVRIVTANRCVIIGQDVSECDLFQCEMFILEEAVIDIFTTVS